MSHFTDKGIWIKSLDIQFWQRFRLSPSSDRHIQRMAADLGFKKMVRAGTACYLIPHDKIKAVTGLTAIRPSDFDTDGNLKNVDLILSAHRGQDASQVDRLTAEVRQLSDTCRTYSAESAEKSEKIAKLKEQNKADKNEIEALKSRLAVANDQLAMASELTRAKVVAAPTGELVNRMEAIEADNAELYRLNDALVKRFNEFQAMAVSRESVVEEDDEDEVEEEVEIQVAMPEEAVEPVVRRLFGRKWREQY